MLVSVIYVQFSKKKSWNYASTFYFKFGENSSITTNKRVDGMHICPICLTLKNLHNKRIKPSWVTEEIMPMGWVMWKESSVTSCETQVPWMWQ